MNPTDRDDERLLVPRSDKEVAIVTRRGLDIDADLLEREAVLEVESEFHESFDVRPSRAGDRGTTR